MMRKFNKIISALLALLMVLGSFAGLAVLGVSADEAEETKSATDPSIYITEIFETPEEKFESLSNPYVKDGFELRVNPITGEVAVKELATGHILFTNPYDVGNSKAEDASPSTEKLLSQVLINAIDSAGNKLALNSYSSAALLGQISVTSLKTGIRVEYSIGEEATRKLVPYRITDIRYQDYILTPILTAYEKGEITYTELEYFTDEEGGDGIYFTKQSLSYLLEEDREEALEKTPILAITDIWQIAPSLEKSILDQIEAVIKKCCPDYSFDMMDEDHSETGFKAVQTAYPLFKMALEYSLDQDGLTVRMPCNGLRYDADSFTLESIQILPYMGAGHNANDGYTFFPEGSGALYDFKELEAKGANVSQPVYGIDFAYHTITSVNSIRNQTPIRYPVYGVVANEKIYSYSYSYYDAALKETVTVSGVASNTVMSKYQKEALEKKSTDFKMELVDEYSRGFVAVIEEGDSLARLETYHAGIESEYNSILTYFNPRPKDEYDLADSISVSGETVFTIVSNRKYTGSVSIRYKMLTDSNKAAAVQKNDPSYVAYNTTWIGMAEYYRDYLINNGTLEKLDADDVEADIPLYIEAFGAMETQQSFLTLPVDMMTPLTTFDNIVTMFNELSEAKVNNVNFKLTGFANGGIYSTVPYDLEWEDVVGGEEGFNTLLETVKAINSAADDKHIGIYPDFDFAYISENTLFDATYLNDDAVKTIDNRYTSKRIYSATQQKYINFYQLAVAPSRYDKFYTELMANYGEFDINSISVGSLGNALNSDFDEDEPYNREDSKSHTADALAAIKNSNDKTYSMMLDSANAYTWAYADHLINMDIDSSHHNDASAAVPFLGVVLHGYVQFAGNPLNEESNIDYAILKALENGASLNFLLSYQNTTYLKEDVYLSQNYSVRYDIWKNDVITYYNELNELLKDVQTKVIIDHQFVDSLAERVLDFGEINDEIASELKDAMDQLNSKNDQEKMDVITSLSDIRVMVYNILNGDGNIKIASEAMANLKDANKALSDNYDALSEAVKELPAFYAEKLAEIAPADTDKDAAKEVVAEIAAKLAEITEYAENVMTASASVQKYQYLAVVALDAIPDAEVFEEAVALVNATDFSDASIKQLYLDELAAAKKAIDDFVAAYEDDLKAEQKLYEDHASYYKKDSAVSAVKLAVNIYAGDQLEIDEDHPFRKDIEKVIKDAKVKEADLLKLGEYVVEEGDASKSESDEAQKSEINAFTVDKNSVVAVTYGDRTENEAGNYDYSAYKTFLLNYNAYAVKLEYDGVLYTIPANGYVAIYTK